MCIQCICVQWYDMYKHVNVNKYIQSSICTTTYIQTQSFLESKEMNFTHNIQHHNRKILRNSRDFHYSRIANIQNWETSWKIYGFWDTVAKDLKNCCSTTGRFCLHMFASVVFWWFCTFFTRVPSPTQHVVTSPRSPRNCKLLQGRPSWRRHKLKPSK